MAIIDEEIQIESIDNKLNELFIAVEWASKGDLKLVMKRAAEDEVSFPEK